MAKAKAKPEKDTEVEVLDDDVEETSTKSDNAVTFGVKDLCDLVKAKTGKEYSTRDMRTLIRKMAREDKPRVEREIVAGNRSRYDWPKGEKDPEVKAIIAAVEKGEIEAGRKEALDKLKESQAEKKAKGDKKGKKGKKAKASEPEPEDDVDEEIEDDEDDE